MHLPVVLFLTDYRGIIPQRIHEQQGLDLHILGRELSGLGYDTAMAGYHEDPLSLVDPGRPTAAIYATSQWAEYASFIRAHLSNMAAHGVTLLPSFEHALAHEDKIYQAPNSWAFGYLSHVERFLRTAPMPLVWKTPRGFGSRGVRLVRTRQEALSLAKRVLAERVLRTERGLLRRVKERVRWERGIGRVLFQEFVPHCEYDWKVLTWGDVACGLKRRNRANDFRASGSGLFEFAEVPTDVLDFAYGAQLQLGLPWGSFDVLVQQKGGTLWLADYQGVHFGLTTALKAKFHYRRDDNGGWVRREGSVPVEAAMAAAVARVWPSPAGQGPAQ